MVRRGQTVGELSCHFEFKAAQMKRSRIPRVPRRGLNVSLHEENSLPLSSSIVKKEHVGYHENEEVVLAETLVTDPKRKRVRSCLVNSKSKRLGAKSKGSCFKRTKDINRWSAERYQRAEQNVLDIMKEKGAVFGNPIIRPLLRAAARTRIGDTGLLDHLLKHMDAKVAPGGAERFRRCYNHDGIMEYWLERADLVDIRREAGVEDPYWIPPSMRKPSDVSPDDVILYQELKLLKAEMGKIKSDVHQLVSKKQHEDQANMTPNSSSVENVYCDKDMHGELLVWKTKTEHQLMEISDLLSGLQDMSNEVEKWKAKVERRITEMSSSFCSSRRDNVVPWFENSELIKFEQDDWWEKDYNFEYCLESHDLVKVEHEVLPNPSLIKNECDTIQNAEKPCIVDVEPEVMKSVENPCIVKIEPEVLELVENPCKVVIEHEVAQNMENPCLVAQSGQRCADGSSQDHTHAEELELLKEDFTKIKRDVKGLATKRDVEDGPNLTSCSSDITDWRMDLDNQLLLLQEMYGGMMKWKDKIRQQMKEISNSLGVTQA